MNYEHEPSYQVLTLLPSNRKQRLCSSIGQETWSALSHYGLMQRYFYSSQLTLGKYLYKELLLYSSPELSLWGCWWRGWFVLTTSATRPDLPSLTDNQIKQNLQPFLQETAANHTPHQGHTTLQRRLTLSLQCYSKLVRKLSCCLQCTEVTRHGKLLGFCFLKYWINLSCTYITKQCKGAQLVQEARNSGKQKDVMFFSWFIGTTADFFVFSSTVFWVWLYLNLSENIVHWWVIV